MKKKVKRNIIFILCMVLTITMLSQGFITNKKIDATPLLSNPRIVPDSKMEAGQRVTWDCVWFGNYPQAEVVSSREYTAVDSSLLQEGDIIVSDSIYDSLKNSTGWNDNTIILNGEKYLRMKKSDATESRMSGDEGHYCWLNNNTYHYFKYEPIKWRVLNVSGNDAFLFADKGLDERFYNVSGSSVTWETCTLRSWLNGYEASVNKDNKDYRGKNFINTAFSTNEINSIFTSKIENNDGFNNHVGNKNYTYDKIFLLSETEVFTDTAIEYGFVSSGDTDDVNDEAKRMKSSTYAKAMGAGSETTLPYEGNTWWWLRSGDSGEEAYYMSYTGGTSWTGCNANSSNAICPVLHLDISSDCWSIAGTVSSDGAVDEEEFINSEINISSANTTNSSYYTNTNSILNYSYGHYHSILSTLGNNFSSFKNTLATSNGSKVEGIIIPGLSQTNQGDNTKCNTMVPQGVCVVGNYLLVSACDESEKVKSVHKSYVHNKIHNSVIYVLNKTTRKYLTTIILNDNTCHVGALAWNQQSGSKGEIYS